MFKNICMCLTVFTFVLLSFINFISCSDHRRCVSRTYDLHVLPDACDVEGGIEKVDEAYVEQKRLKGQKALNELNNIDSKQPAPDEIIIRLKSVIAVLEIELKKTVKENNELWRRLKEITAKCGNSKSLNQDWKETQ